VLLSGHGTVEVSCKLWNCIFCCDVKAGNSHGLTLYQAIFIRTQLVYFLVYIERITRVDWLL
jgi:hypothetical protein